MTETLTPDVCVVGAGSAGLVVAAGAAQLGLDVVLIERAQMGGDCLNFGCVPSKALIAAAKAAQAQRSGAAFGIAPVEPRVDFAKVMDHVAGVIAAIAPNDSVERFERLGVRVLKEEARFVGRTELQAGPHRIRSAPHRAGDRLAADRAADPRPRRRALSHQRDDLRQPHAARPSDRDRRRTDRARNGAGAPAAGRQGHGAGSRRFPRQGRSRAFRHRRRAPAGRRRRSARQRQDRPGRTGTFRHRRGPRRRRTTRRLAPAGRGRPRAHHRGARSRQGRRRPHQARHHGRCSLRTSNRNVWAIGDCNGLYAFTHMAGYEASLFIRGALFRAPAKLDPSIVPWATYTDPELAQVGLSETRGARQARRRDQGAALEASPRTTAPRPSARPTGW